MRESEKQTQEAPMANWVTLAGSSRVRDVLGRHVVLSLGQGRQKDAIGQHLGGTRPRRLRIAEISQEKSLSRVVPRVRAMLS